MPVNSIVWEFWRKQKFKLFWASMETQSFKFNFKFFVKRCIYTAKTFVGKNYCQNDCGFTTFWFLVTKYKINAFFKILK